MGVGVRRYQDLDVWKLANTVRSQVRKLVRRSSFEQHHWLRQQLRRAANSACSNTAEGFGRFKPLVFAQFLRIAHGSMKEITDHLAEASDLELAPKAEIDGIIALADRAGRATAGLIAYLDTAPEPKRKHRRESRNRSRRNKRARVRKENGEP
jgi:four helix bundle protein